MLLNVRNAPVEISCLLSKVWHPSCHSPQLTPEPAPLTPFSRRPTASFQIYDFFSTCGWVSENHRDFEVNHNIVNNNMNMSP